MSLNSRNKGAVGERELAAYLTAHGFLATRGQQFRGSPDSPDVRCEGLAGLHIECKRVERFYLYSALEQATTDAGEDQVPIVFHRSNRREWVVVMRAEDFLVMRSKA